MNQQGWRGLVRAALRTQLIAASILLSAAGCADEGEQPIDSVEQEATSWTLCASEGKRCQFTGTRQVRFGSYTRSIVQTFTNGVDCTTTTIGDPRTRGTKHCWFGPDLTVRDAAAPARDASSSSAADAGGETPRDAAVVDGATPTPTDDAGAPADGAAPQDAATGTPSPADASSPAPDAAAANDAATQPTVPDASAPPADASVPPQADAAVPPTPSASTPQLCTSPIAAVDTSKPTSVVGSGTAASCSEQALRDAVARGGVITFNCGSALTSIAITQTLVAPWDKDTVIDGGDRIVLDGRGTTQILRATSANFRANDRVLTVQRLAMIGGRDSGSGYVARDGTKTCAFGYKAGGGGAISVRDVNLRIWGVRFENNRGPELGPDVAGGAVYVVGAKKLSVANSVFRANSASNGGGVGALHTASELYNVVFEQNRATGTLANFANATGCPTFNHAEQGGAGGLGGAFYSDGFDPGDYFCGVRMADNSAGDLGGAVFRSAYWGLLPDVAKQTITWERSTFEGNRTPVGGGGAAYVNNSLFVLKSVDFLGNDAGNGDGGALKITGLTLRADGVQFNNNKSSWGGGVAHWGGGPEGAGTSANIRFSGNTPNDYVGDFPR